MYRSRGGKLGRLQLSLHAPLVFGELATRSFLVGLTAVDFTGEEALTGDWAFTGDVPFAGDMIVCGRVPPFPDSVEPKFNQK